VTAAEVAAPEEQAAAVPEQQAPAAEKQAAAAPEQQPPAAPEEQAPAAPEEQAPAAEGAPPTAPIEIAPAVPVRPPLRVRVTNSVDEGRSFALESGELIIGREEGSAIQLQDSGVSHNHALLRVHGENMTIEDLRSTNGTKVNGAAIDGQTDLGPGDQIDVGGVQLVVEHN
jgi:pSer/pThr/pTyr-binding forkhead associated (FHA) protein